MSRKKALILAIVLSAALFAGPVTPPAAGAGPYGAPDEYEMADERPYVFLKGVVTADDGWRMVVNEGARVRVGLATELLDPRGVKLGRYALSPGKWVYVEGPVGYDGDVEAEQVYVLPGPVGPRGYPFMKAP